MFVVDEIGIRLGMEGLNPFLMGMQDIQASLFATSNSVMGFAANLSSITAPLTRFRQEAIQAATDFESSFAGVRKTVDASEPRLQELSDAFRQMSLRIPVNVNEINRVAEAAGQLGIQTDALEGFTETMLHLGVTTNLSAEEGATALARLANITQMNQGEFDRLGATIVALGNSGASTEKEIVEMGLRIAGAGKVVGLTEHQILGVANALSSMGITAELGGTAVSKTLTEMASEVATGGKKLEIFARVAKMSTGDFAALFKEDASQALVAFTEGLGQMNKEGGNVFGVLKELKMNTAGVRDVLLRAAGGGTLLRDSLATGAAAWQENNALTKEAEQRYKTFASQMQVMKNHLIDIQIEVGAALLPVMQKLNAVTLDSIQIWRGLSDQQKQVAIVTGAVVTSIAPLLMGFAKVFNVLSFGVKILSSFAGPLKILGAFVTLGGSIPFLGWAAAIVGIGAAIYAVVQIMTGPEGWKGAWEDAKTSLMSYWEATRGFLANFRENMRIVWDWLKLNWREVMYTIGELFLATFKALPELAWVGLKTLVRLWTVQIGWIKGMTVRVFEFIFTQEFVNQVVIGIGAVWEAFTNFLTTLNTAWLNFVVGMGVALYKAAPFLKDLLMGIITMRPVDVATALAGIGNELGEQFSKEILAADRALTAANDRLRKDFTAGAEATNPFDPMLTVIREGAAEAKGVLEDAYSGISLDITTPDFNLDRLTDTLTDEAIADPLADSVMGVGDAAAETGKEIEKMLQPLKDVQGTEFAGVEHLRDILKSQVPDMLTAKAAVDAKRAERAVAGPVLDLDDPRLAPVRPPAPIDDSAAEAIEEKFGPIQGGSVLTPEDVTSEQTDLLDEIATNTRPGNVPEIIIEGPLDL